jgi:formylglycine-generating enzyme required for sulfatase activity
VEVDELGATVQVLDAEGQIVVRGVSEADPLTFSLDPGTHRLRVEKDGFAFFAQDFALVRRGQQVIRAHLEPIPEQPGTVRLTVDQPDAAVEVLDVAGKTVARYRLRDEPLAIPLAAGNYRVLVEKTGFEPFETAVTVPSGVDATIDVALAAMKFTHQPSEASRGTSGSNDQPEGQAVNSPTPVVPLTITRTGPEPPPAIAPFDAEKAQQHQQAWAAHLGIPVEWTNSIGMRFRLIPPGEFEMGSTQEEVDQLLADAQELAEPQWYIDRLPAEVPRHRVRISQPRFLAVHEVTVSQFQQFVTDTGYATDGERDGQGGFGYDITMERWVREPEFTWSHSRFAQSDDHPVVQVSWNDVLAFCTWLSRKEGVTYRLPTEAEWEYTCRAGNPAHYHFGNDPTELIEYAWTGHNSDGESHPVGQKRANPWGLYDMHGNVFEWCADWYDEKYYTASPVDDPTGPAQGVDRVVRGGNWHYPAAICRSARRSGIQPGHRDLNLGFRVAAVLSASETQQEPAGADSAVSTASAIIRTGPEPPPAIAPFDAEQARQHQQAWAAHLGIPAEWTNSIGMKFVLIPPGEFDMGSPESEWDRFDHEVLHQVRLTKPFYLGVHEMTQAQCYAVTGARPSHFEGDNLPVANVS